MKKIILMILLLPFSSLFAQSAKQYLTIMPITGYERVQKLSPTVHTTDRLFYGVRVLFGPPLLSAEAEVTQSKDTETFASQGLVILDESNQAKLGIRTSISLAKFGYWYLRAGGSARETVITKTTAGTTTKSEPAVRINPYAGTGLSFRLMNNFSLNAGVTVIFADYPKKDHEYQTSLGFAINI